MKLQSIQKHFALIITIMIFSAIPEIINAQCGGAWGSRNCPKGYICLYGYCVKKNQGNGHGLVIYTPPKDLHSISGIHSTSISFELTETQNVSLKIYDITGRLVKTIVDSKMPEGYHRFELGTKDETGNAVQAGVYILKMKAGNYIEAKKIVLAK